MPEGKQIDWSKAPEGATHYCPETEEVMAAWFKPSGSEWLFTLEQPRVRHWRPFLDDFPGEMPVVERPATWSGEGLPPVGVVCEAMSARTKEYRQCEVLAIRNGMAVVVFPDHEEIQWASEFRPIRTAEQIAAEEREKALEAMFKIYRDAGEFRAGLSALYDAGCRLPKVES